VLLGGIHSFKNTSREGTRRVLFVRGHLTFF